VRAFWLGVGLVCVVGCFDPLYELNPNALWAACCRDGAIDTCECAEMQQCSFEITACALGTCVNSGTCSNPGGGQGGGSSGTGGGSSGTGGGSASGGGSAGTGGGGWGIMDSGVPVDGGMAIDAGPPPDAGQPDAGPPPDAGHPQDAGMSGDGGFGPPEYELCCPDATHVLTSCLCPPQGCLNEPFTACSMGRCVPGAGQSCPN
jgi:hypothetical protein